jgi:CCR4-NOT transcription complex subunit 1
LFENWKNSAGQLSFLKLAVAAPPDIFNFASSSSVRIDAEGLPSVGKTLNQSWYSLSLIETLLRLAETENYSIVRNVFNYPIKHCPELLLLGLAQVKVERHTAFK